MNSEGQRLALVVASSEFSDETLQQLVTPGQDAADLASVLEDIKAGGFDQVKVLTNQPSYEVRREIEAFSPTANGMICCCSTFPGTAQGRRRAALPGDRARVREWAADAALALVRLRVLAVSP